MLEETVKVEENDIREKTKPLFTKSRIYFLIVVVFVFSLPLIFRYVAKFLNM